ncbi:carboxypeptidase C (cathepsin A) [Novosphingobium sp. PhB165]|uniref:S10 family serine carboxypeptidase-like protein n=1 Tax=Novosphingobium sp. PhB165 TaxID=2485105 RepID=UPI0010507B51|nr:peptidase S10 [Novosphingobium sp. PhB165]TCM15421.1 carboxypeptidase C (cathepsin A) [Novosphingobium sp. PhB165]
MPAKPLSILGALLAAIAAPHIAQAHADTRAVTHGANPPACPAGASGTQGSLSAERGAFAYRACAGTIAIADETGAKAADLFYTAYLAAAQGTTPRPIAFVWNGGPGADSRLLQFHALGPRTLKGEALSDNPDSPLAVADLVFVDPAGTGFSRAASDKAAERLYSTTGDFAATARFIRAFLKAQHREGSPVSLVGESFGTWRASGVAEALIDQGQPVAGIALISGGIPMGEERDRALMRALTLPNRTATALALGKLDAALAADPAAALAASEDWARRVWYPALAHPEALDDAARAKVVADLGRYTGLAPARIDAMTLWVSPRDFRRGLLAGEGKTLGIFDMRRTDAAEDEKRGSAAILDFYRRQLGYAGGQYAGIDVPALPVGEHWQYDQSPITKESLARAMAGEGPPSASQPWVQHVLEKAPESRVFVATGLYDSLNGCAANRQAAGDFPPALAARIAAHCYPGGHMMYEDPAASRQFVQDLSAFISNPQKRAKQD